MTIEKRLDDYTIDGDVHKVLMNDEGQYSIWPAGQRLLMDGKKLEQPVLKLSVLHMLTLIG